MSYSLAIHKKGYETLNIENYSALRNPEDFNENFNEKSLEDIISFTNDFTCEEELIEALLNFNLIPKNYYDGTIGIRYYKNNNAEPRILKFGVSYKNDKNKFKLDNILSIYNSNLEDDKFIGAFINQYLYLFRNHRTMYELVANIAFIYRKKITEGLKGEEYELYRSKMRKFILTYCTRRNNNNEYAPTINGIRELAMFAIDYERKNSNTKERNKFKEPNYFNNLKANLYHYEELMNTEGLTEEEYKAYQKKIDDLMYDITLISDYDINSTRGINDEITRH